MDEFQAPGVEALAGQAGPGLSAAVHRVAKERVADRGQMDPDLMGAARLQPAFHMGKAPVPGQHGPVGHGRAACSGFNRHPLAVHRVPVSYTHLTLPTT